jgi:hypothetical protein
MHGMTYSLALARRNQRSMEQRAILESHTADRLAAIAEVEQS